jgi:glycosyltransferase involved in cell wall biosynthesis
VPDKPGWPWTDTNSPLPITMPNGVLWPRISIVTPSFNQGEFLEETIRSVLLQGYPNLEYIIIDGGSTDNSVDIIRKYEPWLTYWVSEPDHGQAHAINKGLALATGEIFNWLNSDDLLMPNALAKIAGTINQDDALAGGVINFTEEKEILYQLASLTPFGLINWLPEVIFVQPGLWLRREHLEQCGGIDQDFHYAFDWDMVIRYLSLYPNVRYIPDPLVRFRLHAASKTVSSQERFHMEEIYILKKLQNLSRFKILHSACNRRLRRIEWSNTLSYLMNDRSVSNWQRPFRIAKAICSDPFLRWSRFSIGAIRLVTFRAIKMSLKLNTK